MKVLLDNNISPLVAEALHVLVASDGHQVIALREKFAPSTKDVDWIDALGKETGWSVSSGDIHITKRPAERRAWTKANLKGFFLAPGWSKMTNLEKTARLLRWWPFICAQEALVAPGAIFQVPINPSSRLHQLRV